MSNTSEMTPRLKVIVDFAKNCKECADIGCDHGKVSVNLAKLGIKVHASDISLPSLEKAKKLADKEGVSDKIEFYCSDGMQRLINENIDCAIIAGMGWRTIASIIDNNYDFVKRINKLILQPMDSVPEIRVYLKNKSFEIIDEKLVWDDGRLYTVICAKYGSGKELSPREIILGPKIIEQNDNLLGDLIEKELKKRNIVLEGLKKSNIERKEQLKEIEKEIKIIKGVEKFGSNDRQNL